MADHYQLPGPVATPVPPLTGNFLARNQESRIVRAFLAADLHRGFKRLDKPTRLQAAFLARVSPTYVCWAEKRMAERWEIERGLIPLVPVSRAEANGATLAPALTTNIDDVELMHIAQHVGTERWLAAGAAAGL